MDVSVQVLTGHGDKKPKPESLGRQRHLDNAWLDWNDWGFNEFYANGSVAHCVGPMVSEEC